MYFLSYVVTEVMAVRPVTWSQMTSKTNIMDQKILYSKDVSVLFYTFNSSHKCNRAEVNGISFFYLSAH